MKSKLLPLLTLVSLSCLGVAQQLHASTVTVNTNDDVINAETCSLRAAIETVNKGMQVGGCVPSDASTPDTVNLPSSDQPYVLSIAGTKENGCDNGDLDVLENLTLNGGGSGSTIISAAGLKPDTPERVFDINPQGNSIDVVLNGVTIQDGQDFGGAGIQVFGEAFNNISFIDLGKLGSLGSATSLVLNDVVVTNNQATFNGGGIFDGGADLTLNNSQVIGNETELWTGGGISMEGGCLGKCLVDNSGGLLTLQDSTVSNNTVAGRGGGIYSETEILMDSSTVSGNTAGEDGGGIYSSFGALALITNSTLSGNEALGQTIEVLRFPDLKLAGFGDTGYGGGLFQEPNGQIALVNSTVSGNTAFASGGGVAIVALPQPPAPQVPAMKLIPAPASTMLGLFNVTIADNTAETKVGGGLFVFQPVFSDLKAAVLPFQSMVANTLIADNSAELAGPDCIGPLTSLGYNLIGKVDENCTGFTGTGDQVGTLEAPIDPMLADLANNGGPTATRALKIDSPAIDAANPDGCLDEDGNLLTRDQRNFKRPVNITGKPTAICDIGAFEVGTSLLKVVKTDNTAGKPTAVGSTFTYTITVTNEGPDAAPDVQLNDPLPAQVNFVGPITASQGSCTNIANTVKCDLDALALGATATVSFPVIAVAPSNAVVNTVTVTSTPKDFEQGQTYTASVTTNLGGGLIEGAGCGLNPAGTATGSLATLAALAFALSLFGLGRLRRES
ncbi:MAG: DUF11 domain-containing protein [bacterium]